jgi:hypothetical protein
LLRLVLRALSFFVSFSWDQSDIGGGLDPDGKPKPTSDIGGGLDPNG